ncbi:MAG TPA: AbrB/MazE/SpoVT family DNA-binding domain-containing protein [Candidatus Acidoferrum sp.]|jgi:AbrB family looped-hinge helix DNA binding protein
MQTTISTKGQVVLPSRMRDRLGLRPGDKLDAHVEGGRIVLTPKQRRKRKARIVIDPRTKLATLTLGTGAAVITSKQVRDILADFP